MDISSKSIHLKLSCLRWLGRMYRYIWNIVWIVGRIWAMNFNSKSKCSKNDNLDRINESCSVCRKHFVRVEDVYVGIDDDRYYCLICAKELHIDICECRDM